MGRDNQIQEMRKSLEEHSGVPMEVIEAEINRRMMEKKKTSLNCVCGVLEAYESCEPRTAFFLSKESIEQLICDLGKLLTDEQAALPENR
jgi:hypothetical protein